MEPKVCFNEKRLATIVEKAVKNALKASTNSSSESHSPLNYLDSIVELADFLGCSYKTALRFKMQGRIKFHQNGCNVRFFIPDVFDAFEKDPCVGRYLEKCFRTNPSENQQQKTKPKVSIQTELDSGRFMFIHINYQHWGCTVVCSPDLWNDQIQINEIIRQIILAQNKRKPFKIQPNELN
jgi:hypothetical protein